MKGLFLPALILLAVVLGCSGPRAVEQSKASPTPGDRKLSADVRLSQKGVTVKNTDSTDFPSMTLKLNLKNWGSDDGRVDIGGLAVGKSITIPYGEFTVGTTRFSPQATKIMTIYVKSGDGASKLFVCPGPICQPA